MNYDLLPPSLRVGMQRYIEDGIRPGSFLTAVLENNLRKSFAAADSNNTERIHDIVSWFYNEIPASFWGSPEAVEAHLQTFYRECDDCGKEVHVDFTRTGSSPGTGEGLFCLDCLGKSSH